MVAGPTACLEEAARQKALEAHRVYIEALRRLGPEGRLQKAFELGKQGRELFVAGLRRRHPDLPEHELEELLRERLSLCHNRNW